MSMTDESKKLNDLRTEVLQECIRVFDKTDLVKRILNERITEGIDQVIESKAQAVAREKVYRLLRVARENSLSIDDLLDQFDTDDDDELTNEND